MKEDRGKKESWNISFSARKSAQGAVRENLTAPNRPGTLDTPTTQFWDPTRMRFVKNLIAMIHYIPARLVRAKDRWYILYYQTNPTTGKRERHRVTFDLGRLRDKQGRLQAAKDIVDSINARLPYGYPYDEDFYSRTVTTNVEQAFQLVEQLGADLRHATKLSYAYSMRKFLSYLKMVGLYNEPIDSITKRIAMAFSDYLILQGLTGRSHNNDINEMKRVFNVLKSRDIITVNPFDGVPKRRVEPKQRRALNRDEVVKIFERLRVVDKSTYLSCALLYFCFIRPNEQRFLQAADVNLQEYTINIDGKFSKNRKTAFVTIPEQLKQILLELGITSLHPHDYLLGCAKEIGNKTPVGKSSISNRYRAVIQEMHNDGILASIKGNALYSWKDTGATALGRSGINGIGLRDQMRHHSLAESQTYIEQSRVANEFIKDHHRI